jgi:cation diffusion facilitator CzcD-associated flavoprotein CzcO
MDVHCDSPTAVADTGDQIIKDSPEQVESVQFSINEMKKKLGEDSPLLKYMIPSFAVGCRRPTPGNGYLESLTKDNVRVVTSSIAEIVPDGVKLTTGEVISVDIFVCATGFDISFRPRYPVVGLNGITLAEQWKVKPDGYLSLAVPNFPNHFSMMPLTPIFGRQQADTNTQCSLALGPPLGMDRSFLSLSTQRNTYFT